MCVCVCGWTAKAAGERGSAAAVGRPPGRPGQTAVGRTPGDAGHQPGGRQRLRLGRQGGRLADAVARFRFRAGAATPPE